VGGLFPGPKLLEVVVELAVGGPVDVKSGLEGGGGEGVDMDWRESTGVVQTRLHRFSTESYDHPQGTW